MTDANITKNGTCFSQILIGPFRLVAGANKLPHRAQCIKSRWWKRVVLDHILYQEFVAGQSLYREKKEGLKINLRRMEWVLTSADQQRLEFSSLRLWDKPFHGHSWWRIRDGGIEVVQKLECLIKIVVIRRVERQEGRRVSLKTRVDERRIVQCLLKKGKQMTEGWN